MSFIQLFPILSLSLANHTCFDASFLCMLSVPMVTLVDPHACFAREEAIAI